SKVIRDSADALVSHAQKAGVVREDVDAKDVIRLVHGVSLATQRAPSDPEQTDRLLGLILDGLRPQPAGSA
ncbi:MAG TPA: TetR/AcrR family transcriptional regulator, partial [Streptosporangiaceae bacterium]